MSSYIVEIVDLDAHQPTIEPIDLVDTKFTNPTHYILVNESYEITHYGYNTDVLSHQCCMLLDGEKLHRIYAADKVYGKRKTFGEIEQELTAYIHPRKVDDFYDDLTDHNIPDQIVQLISYIRQMGFPVKFYTGKTEDEKTGESETVGECDCEE